ncbi:MAG: hypothetical protein DRJ40_06575 [Thermoprotei archaeon]|nr:MAG: hypothetical protein DRJ40_06575 [Thermoprotei archaeon]
MVEKFKRVLSSIREVVSGVFSGFAEAGALDAVELECSEYEHVFLLLLFGSLIGIPSPPLTLTLRLLPHIVDELRVLEQRSRRASDMIADLVSSLGLEL